MAKKAPPKKVKKAAAPKKPAQKAVPVAKKAVAKTKVKSKAKVVRKAVEKPKAVMTSGKKIIAGVGGLGKADLQYFRNLLLEKRNEILGDVGSMESEAFKSGSNLSNMPIHMADVGTDNFEQEFTLGLIASERQILREIRMHWVALKIILLGSVRGRASRSRGFGWKRFPGRSIGSSIRDCWNLGRSVAIRAAMPTMRAAKKTKNKLLFG